MLRASWTQVLVLGGESRSGIFSPADALNRPSHDMEKSTRTPSKAGRGIDRGPDWRDLAFNAFVYDGDLVAKITALPLGQAGLRAPQPTAAAVYGGCLTPLHHESARGQPGRRGRGTCIALSCGLRPDRFVAEACQYGVNRRLPHGPCCDGSTIRRSAASSNHPCGCSSARA